MADVPGESSPWRDERGRTRRDVLRSGALVLVSVSALGAGLHRLTKRDDLPTTITRGTFEPFVGEQYGLRSSDGALHHVDLFKVRALRGDPGAATLGTGLGGQESFSLLFRGSASTELPQDVYRVEHRSADGLSILVVPMRPEPDARFYEAIFNRSRPS